MPHSSYDFIVVGAGPNGLTAAATLATAGARVLLLEAADTPGGGCRSAPLTLPGFLHDICSAIYPIAALSPAFRELGLQDFGLEFIRPDAALAHPLPDDKVAILQNSLDATCASLGPDGPAWQALFQPLLSEDFLAALLRPAWFGLDHAWLRLRFGLAALRSCERLANTRFQTPQARALFAGCCAHSFLPLDRAGSAAFGLVLATAGQVVGWPCLRGGSQQITDALLRKFIKLGGVLELSRRITNLDQLPEAKAILLDLNPHQIAQIGRFHLPARYCHRLEQFRLGPGVFKLDWALSGPVPWANPECARSATVHVGGTYEEIVRSEAEVAAGVAPHHPFVLLAQPSLFDPTRSPPGQHVGWAYCHVPNGCTMDMTQRIEAQVERFAPGFRDRIIARHTISPAQLEAHNLAMPGGDISGGANDLVQLFFRPTRRWNPHTTPNRKIFICSSSTPPGGGVHGMCGYLAARAALRRYGAQW